MDKNKLYKMVINPDDETGIDFNSFVDVPAHLKGFIAFGKNEEQVRYSFNDEKRLVTGVMVSAGTIIERYSKDLGQHWVYFDAESIDIARKKFFSKNYNQNLNTDHNPEKVTKGAVLVDSYIISSSDPKFPQAPEAFSRLNLQDGTWIATYHVTDDQLWQDVKDGKFNGFSVEGWFEKQEIKLKTKMRKQTKSIWDLFKSNTPKANESFAMATTADGVAVSYEGELAEGVALSVEVDGETLPAPEGEHELTFEDGSVKIVTVDANGLITAVADFVPNSDESEEEMNNIRQEVADAMTNLTKEVHSRFEAIEKENESFKSENASLKAELEAIKSSEKFGAKPNASAGKTEQKLTISEIVAKSKK